MMKVEYRPIASENPVEEAKKRISKRNVTILSRLRGEVVAIIPSSRHDDPTFHWVWLSSSEGAYLSRSGMTLEEVARCIVGGEWTFQPNAHIVLEEGDRTNQMDMGT
jgi:hypothetical protein